MRIWEVTVNTNMVRFYFFPTKKEADEFVRQERKSLEEEWGDRADFSVEPWDLKPNRKGIAGALNDVIAAGCFNDG